LHTHPTRLGKGIALDVLDVEHEVAKIINPTDLFVGLVATSIEAQEGETESIG
jgi:hypothetical protein